MVRINRVYTKSGDNGTTALVGGKRVAKHELRIEAYGTVDELNAALGLAQTALTEVESLKELSRIIPRVQNELFNLGAQLATPEKERLEKSPAVTERHITALETEMDELNGGLPELRSFVLPGGGYASSFLHLARTICRRAERRASELTATGELVPTFAVRYLNRLSDAIFVWGRFAVHAQGLEEPLWVPEET